MEMATNIPQEESQGQRWQLWLRWTIFVAVGEFIGFAAPTAAGALLFAVGLPEMLIWLGVILAGSVEGATLGFAQWLVLRGCFPRLTRRSWVLPTALGAVFAYALALILNLFLEAAGPDFTTIVAGGAAVIGIVFLLSIGLPQWLVLRRHVRRAGWWIPTNAVAWPLGVAAPFVALSVIPDSSPTPIVIAAGIIGGLMMGVIVGAITGAVLVLLLRNASPLSSREVQR